MPVTLDNMNVCINNIIKGKLVIFPTETVFGLSTNAFDENAINKIYQAKNDHSQIL